MKKLKLALLGFGNAGQAFCRLLLEKTEEIKNTYETEVIVTAIATSSKGNIYDPEGMNPAEALEDVSETGKFTARHRLTEMSTMEIAEKADYDVLVEMTPLNIFTGQPAADHIRAAFRRRKHAITANKGPIAWYFRELSEMAKDAGACFFYETTVMDGAPVFNLTEKTLKMAKVTEVSGILNSTTNFILEELAK